MFLTRRNFLSTLFFVSLTAMLFSCGGDDDATPDPTSIIIPGQGLTEVKLGDTGQAVFDAFGETPDSYFGAGGTYTHFLLYLSLGLNFNLEQNDSETLDLTKKVTKIIIEDPFEGKTEEGIGLGSTMAEVKTAYGDPDSEGTSFGKTEHTYDIGLILVYDETNSDTVVKITIE